MARHARDGRIKSLCAGLLLAGLIGLAAPPAAAQETFAFRHLTTDDGLSGDSVYCMLQDRRGYLWLGTFSGLSRYDGSRVVVYRPVPGDAESLSSSLIFDIHEDATGTLWIATDGGGLARYSRDSDAFDRFVHDPSIATSAGSDRMFAVCDDPYGWIWVGTADAGIDRLDTVNGTFEHYRLDSGLPSETVRSLVCDAEGTLWAGTTRGLARFDRGRNVFVAVDSAGSNTVRAIMEDADHTLLVGTDGSGVYRLDQARTKTTRVYLGPDSDALLIRAMVRDLYGRIWVGTEDRGLRVVSADGATVTAIQSRPGAPAGLSHNAIRSLLVDQSGLVWVGTRGGGASACNPRSVVVQRLGTGTGPPGAEIRQMLESADHTLWIATDGDGLIHTTADGRPLRRFRYSASDRYSLPGDRIISLAEAPGGQLWVGTDGGGLARLDPSTGRATRLQRDPLRPESLGGDTVWALLLDRQGTLWVGLEGGGLDRLNADGTTFTHHVPKAGDRTSISGNSVRALLQDSKGRIWIGLWDGGLTRWDPTTDKALAVYKPANDSRSLADASVTCLFEDSRGTIWVGTGGSGVDRMHEDSYMTSFEHLGTHDGLASDDIIGILQDAAGTVWIVSGRGISRLDSTAAEFLSWGPADGFQQRFSQNAYLARSDGRFMLGGPEGIDLFRPDALDHPDIPPPVVFANVSVVALPDDEPARTSIRARAFRAALNRGIIELRPEDAALVLDFAVLDYVDPLRNRLSVTLWGGPAEKMELGSQNRAVLGGLAPGDYELRLSGATAGGVWNHEGAVLQIMVKPPFWKTGWFIAIVVAVALSIGLFIIVARTKSLQRQAERLRTLSMHIQDAREEERKTAAREVHDELGQLLTAAKMDLSWMKNHPPAPDDYGTRVGEAIAMVDSAIDSVKSIATRLRPRALDTLSLSEALRWQLEDFRRRSSVDCHAIIDPAPEDIAEGAATTMFRVFQEILTNVGRHAQASRVYVHFAVGDGVMMLEVKDDGMGLPDGAAGSAESLGILGMRERVRHEGGAFDIESPLEEFAWRGTKVTVSIPLGSTAKEKTGNA